MKCIKFSLSGNTAHFKKPDVNSYCYYTYNHIPKVQLLGIIGAIIGLSGYTQQADRKYPEFYQRLNNLEVAIIPRNSSRGLYGKKIQTYNNSVGYASFEQGNNLIVREQWLEDVNWDIIINLESEIEKELLHKIEDYLLNSKFEYIPYLGKNDHPADITGVKVFDAQQVNAAEMVHSLFEIDKCQLDDDTYDDMLPYMYKDYLPIGLDENNMYLFTKVGYSNRFLLNSDLDIYNFENFNFTFL